MANQVESVLEGDPQAPMIEHGGAVRTRGDIAKAQAKFVAQLEAAGVPRTASIGLVGRNRALHGAALIGLLAGGWQVTMIYAFQSPTALANDVVQSRFAAIFADIQDWSPEVIEAARATGTVGIALDAHAFETALVTGTERYRVQDPRQLPSDIAIEVLSSGTTGKPKRIPLQWKVLDRAVAGMRATGRAEETNFDISTWPLSSIGGVCSLLGNVMLGRPIAYLDKFEVGAWVEAVKRHKPTRVTGVPTMLRMILDADVPPEEIAGIKEFYGGSAPLDPELKDAFEARYGIAVLWAYGATEFCGTIVSWTKALRDAYGDSKRGASGKALPGVTLRAVDADGRELPPGEEGFLEARIPLLGPDWIHTNDLVVLDEDGFMFHHGRSDGAIMRGGFKVLPETIREALCLHPAVLDASAVGIPDDRLGFVPVAAVELRREAVMPTPEALIEHLREKLPSQAIPKTVLIVDALPRTPTLKVEIGAVRAMFV